MEGCSVVKGLSVVRGDRGDYEELGRYHYRGGKLGVYAAIFALKGKFATATRLETVGVIVYTMPSAGCELREAAMGGLFGGLDRRTRLLLVNRNIRCIGRVVIEPRFRGLGLAARLVNETMGLMDVPIVESLAVMGRYSGFFEKAGMTAYEGAESARCVRMREAFGMVGVGEADFVRPGWVHELIERLSEAERGFIEKEMGLFLLSYGRRREMEAGIERTRYVLSRLGDRPGYYVWRNPEVGLKI